MPKYVLQEKRCYHIDGVEFTSAKDCVSHLKKMIRDSCPMKDELSVICEKDSPSPKYRASVYKYLRAFFYTDKYPSANMIDYSDYEGTHLDYDPHAYEEDEVYEIGTAYEQKLGFVFAAGKKGMRFGFLTGAKTICAFNRFADRIEFEFEPFSGSPHGLSARIQITDGTLPPKINGSIFPLMLLSLFLNGTKCPIEIKKGSDANLDRDPEASLLLKMENTVFETINKGFVLPAQLSFSKETVENYIKLLKDLGYDIRNDGDDYYLPPLICKSDAVKIIESIRLSDLPECEKENLIKRFEEESGYHRYAKDEFEETDRLTIAEIQGTSAYPLLILNMLRACKKPIQITPKSGLGLLNMLKTKYGISIERKAIYRNVDALIAVGYPIKKTPKGIYLEASDTSLTEEDLEMLEKCVNDSSSFNLFEKRRVLKKLQTKLKPQ